MFKSKQDKEIQKRLLIKKTVAEMNRHISKLEAQKRVYIEAAKRSIKQGLKAQYDLALSGLKMTLGQIKKANEMLLNFEITSQMKDMATMTTEFLRGMGVLSKEMIRLTNEKQFAAVQRDFEKAMVGSEAQTMRMEAFLDQNQSTFTDASAAAAPDKISDEELEKLIQEQVSQDEIGNDTIDQEIEEIKKRLKA